MANVKPLVSIIIPCYNLQGYIETCINSCLVQSYNNIEIVVVNDGSTDATKGIIENYAFIDQRIILIHKNNEGVAQARRYGILAASGDYLLFLDGDDALEINAIDNLLKELLISEADIVKGEYLFETVDGYEVHKYQRYGTYDSKTFLKQILKERLFTICGILFSRHLFAEQLDYQKGIKRGEDATLLALLVCKAFKVVVLEKTVFYYRLRQGSITHSISFSNFGDAILSRFKIEAYALKAGLDKEKDFELAEFVCFSLVLYLQYAHAAPEIGKQLIKNKIAEYLICNYSFKEWYSGQYKKNYLRLKFFYRWELSNSAFEFIYKYKLVS